MFLNINTNGCVVLTNKLEKISRSALPVAIRGALNQTVKDIKQNTMPASARDKFNQRQKNFFTANSKFEYAKGFKINDMKAMVGFYENKLSNATTNFAVKDLEEQEHGGGIGSKAFIPMAASRISGKGNVKAAFRLKKIRERGFVDMRKQRAATKSERFIKAVFKAGSGGFVLGSTKNGENILWRINSLSSKINTKNLDLTPLYDYSKGRSVKVHATAFMKQATMVSANRMESYYISQAKTQLQKYYGK